jgi:creatinine deaminase
MLPTLHPRCSRIWILLLGTVVIRSGDRNIQHPSVHVLSMEALSKDECMQAAIEEARLGLHEGGIPIGAVLVIDGVIVGRGHNRRVQNGSAVLHAEMDCLENAGRLKAGDYRRAVLYSTLSPCDMCSGAVLLYNIPTVVIGEHRTFQGPEEYLRSRGVELVIMNNEECVRMMQEFIAARPALWNEDIGEE